MNELPRRTVLAYGLSALTGLAFSRTSTAAEAAAEDKQLSIEKFSASGVSEGLELVSRVEKSDAEWRAQLSALAYQVTRHENTERAFSGEYDKNHADGLYRCICCDTALFDSKTKFDSRTGWPSFWQPLSTHNINKIVDNSFGMRRVAVECRRCDAHLGHVFEDGPKPTGLRYCMNSVSLNFVPRAQA